VATAGSEETDDALAYPTDFGDAMDGSITVVHAVDTAVYEGVNPSLASRPPAFQTVTLVHSVILPLTQLLEVRLRDQVNDNAFVVGRVGLLDLADTRDELLPAEALSVS